MNRRKPSLLVDYLNSKVIKIFFWLWCINRKPYVLDGFQESTSSLLKFCDIPVGLSCGDIQVHQSMLRCSLSGSPCSS